MARFTSSLRQHLAALRILLVLTAVLGVLYPLAVTAAAQLPGLKSRADGSLVRVNGSVVGSRLLGQSFLDPAGNPLVQYLQPRPSAAGKGYDGTASAASNLGPESVVDTLPDPATAGDTGTPSLLTQVCTRSPAVGHLEGVDGSRPYCTPGGVGAVLAVFHGAPRAGAIGYSGPVVRVVSVNEACPATPFLAAYAGVAVQCATFGEDYSAGQIVPIRGSAPADPAVPADAVTASASGLDPGISPAYARLQAPRIAEARGIPVGDVQRVIDEHRSGRALGFLGEPTVDVLQVNLALDREHPYRTQ
jgi:K+-transporting ATPase ATPase C chain